MHDVRGLSQVRKRRTATATTAVVAGAIVVGASATTSEVAASAAASAVGSDSTLATDALGAGLTGGADIARSACTTSQLGRSATTEALTILALGGEQTATCGTNAARETTGSATASGNHNTVIEQGRGSKITRAATRTLVTLIAAGRSAAVESACRLSALPAGLTDIDIQGCWDRAEGARDLAAEPTRLAALGRENVEV